MRMLACLAVLAVGAWGADRPDLSGTWVLDTAHSPAAKVKTETLAIHQQSDAVQISDDTTESSGKEVKVDITCNTDGEQCKVKENGQATQVSFWYNGPTLIMMEQRHGNDYVTQKKMRPSDDGKTLNVEVVYIAPTGHKPETLTYEKR